MSLLPTGQLDWSNQRTEAEWEINRALEARWYRDASAERGLDWQNTPFDAALVLTTEQLKRWSCYLTLAKIYELLSKDAAEPDAFERLAEKYEKKATDEGREVLSYGIDYDWDESGTIEATEKEQRVHRALVRM